MAARDRISDGKYVVFKVDDFYCAVQGLFELWGKIEVGTIEDVVEQFVVQDATVIRDQDMLSATTLDAYADACLLVSDLLSGMDAAKDKVNDMMDRADFFKARAERARQSSIKKLPD